jgi:hypothetical protein
MSVSGRIAIDVQFIDRTSKDSESSLNTLTLQDATEYTTGKVAIIAGTCGTAAVTIALVPTSYRDASGGLVSFATVSRIAFAADSSSFCNADGEDQQLLSSGNRACVTDVFTPTSLSVGRVGTSGTASFTLVLYGT